MVDLRKDATSGTLLITTAYYRTFTLGSTGTVGGMNLAEQRSIALALQWSVFKSCVVSQDGGIQLHTFS
jgi:hypothetical protein